MRFARVVDTPQGGSDAVSNLTIKDEFTVCRDIFCGINGAPIGRLVDGNMRKERALLAQADTKTKVPFADSNGKPDKSDGSDAQVAKISAREQTERSSKARRRFSGR
jgi:hypothetical protein